MLLVGHMSYSLESSVPFFLACIHGNIWNILRNRGYSEWEIGTKQILGIDRFKILSSSYLWPTLKVPGFVEAQRELESQVDGS